MPIAVPQTGAVTGIDFLIFVYDDDQALVAVGGGRNATLNRNTNVIDASYKGTGGAETYLPGLIGWTMSHEGVLLEDDAAYGLLEDAWQNRALVAVRCRYPSGKVREGWAFVSNLVEAGPHNDVATANIELQGSGQLVQGTEGS